jgi:hypothetical protein
MFFRKILLFLFVCFSEWCRLEAQPLFSWRSFNFEAARFTVAPRFSPLVAIPLVPFKLYVYDNKTRASGYGGISGLIGADWHYYAPNSRFTFGWYTDFVQQQLTIHDELYPTFTTNEFHLSPYLHFKTGGFDKVSHWDFNGGLTFIGVFSHNAKYYNAGQLADDFDVKSINKLRIEPYFGLGRSFDLTEMDKNVSEIFFASRIRLLTAGFQLHLPIPWFNASSVFNKVSQLDNNPLDKYRTYRATRGYLTFTVGVKMDLRAHNYRDSHVDTTINGLKKALVFLHPPHALKEPIHNTFGGFHIDMSYQPAFDSLNYSDNKITARHAFRNGLNYCIGYNVHFLGNYKLVQNVARPITYDIFAGLQITNRNYIPESGSPARYHTTALGADLGIRGGWNGIYLSAGGEVDYNFINQKLVQYDGIATGIKLLKPLTFNGFLGLSWRNILQVKVKRNPLFAQVEGTSFLKQLETWISVGF